MTEEGFYLIDALRVLSKLPLRVEVFYQLGNEFRVFLQRGADILRQEGLLSLSGRAVSTIFGWFYRCENYLLWRHNVDSLDEAQQAASQPRMTDVAMRIVRSAEEADALASDTGFDFRRHLPGSSKRLESGAVAFCVLVGRKFAGTGWVAMSEKAKKTVDPLPYRVDFALGQACAGSAITFPEYRNRGLMAYGILKRSEFLKENGFKELIGAIETRNAGSIKGTSKIGHRIYAQARLISFLGQSFWKETPLV